MRVRILGPIELVDDVGVVVPISAPQRRTVLAALASRLNTAVSTSHLLDIVWENDPPPRARTALQVHISALRRLLSSDIAVETGHNGYMLVGESNSIDALEFEALASKARVAEDVEAVRLLRAALALWNGPALSDVTSQELQDTVAVHLMDARTTVVEALAERCIRLDRAAEVLHDLTEEAARNPLNESLIETFMRALYSTGRQADALTLYDKTRHQLADALGVDPGPQLRRAHALVLNNDPLPSVTNGGHPAKSAQQQPPATPPQNQGPPPSQLPRDVSSFTGRAGALDWLDSVTADSSGSNLLLVVGPAGVGKTALVTRWAHRIAGQFPDGQLFVNLHGFDDSEHGSTEMTMALFLRSLGVPSSKLPQDMESQASLYRQLLTDRRMLIVLDNASDAEQIRPLLPGRSKTVVVVTSRRRLDGLVVHENAATFSLDVMSEQESMFLLSEVIGHDLVDKDPAPVRQLARLCEHLPLALRIIAAQLTTRPSYGVRALAAELADEKQRLSALSTIDAEVSVEASLAFSYQSLTEDSARLFELLAIYPGHEIDTETASALTGFHHDRAGRALVNLAAVHLLERTGNSRFAAHDLVRLYSNHVAETLLDGAAKHAAAGRMLHYYVTMTGKARAAITSNRRPAISAPAQEWVPVAVPDFDSALGAITWFLDEGATIRGLITQAEELGHPSASWLMAANVNALYRWAETVTRCFEQGKSAIAAARRANSPLGLVLALRSLGTAYTDAHETELSHVTLTEAVAATEQLPDPTIMEARGVRSGLLRTIALTESKAVPVSEKLIAGSAVTEAEEPFLAATTLWLLAVAKVVTGEVAGALDLVDRPKALPNGT